MNIIKGVISGSIHDKEGRLVKNIFRYNYDTMAGRVAGAFDDDCYRLTEFSVTKEVPDLVEPARVGDLVKMPMFPNEPMFVPSAITLKGEVGHSGFGVSYDGGTTWYAYDGSDLNQITVTDAASLLIDGMTSEQLESIPLAKHLTYYTDSIVVVVAPDLEDYFEGYTVQLDYETTKSDASYTRWIGDIKNMSRYTFTRVPMSIDKTVDGDVTTYDLQVSNVGGSTVLSIRNILSECNTGDEIATFANVNIDIDPDHILIGKYQLTVYPEVAIINQRADNAEYMFTGSVSPTYTDGALSVSIAGESGMFLRGPCGYNGPAPNSTVFPTTVGPLIRNEMLDRTILMDTAIQYDHNVVDPLATLDSTGNISLTSSDTVEGFSALTHLPVYMRMRITTTGSESTAKYVPHIQHRPDALFTGRLSLQDTPSSTVFFLDFLRKPDRMIPWNYLDYYDISVTEEVPRSTVNPFDDIILDTYIDKLVIRRNTLGSLLTVNANANEEMIMAWASRSDPSGRDIYLVSLDTNTGETTLSSLPVTFVVDVPTKSITTSTDGDLTERVFLGNTSNPNSPYAMLAKEMVEINEALAGDFTPANILTDLEGLHSDSFGSYVNNTLGGTLDDGSNLLNQNWGFQHLVMSGDVTMTTGGGGEDVADTGSNGFAYTDETSDNLSQRLAQRPSPALHLQATADSLQNATIAQVDDVRITSKDDGDVTLVTGISWPNHLDVDADYAWFCGGESDDDFVRLAYADDTTTLTARANTTSPRKYSAMCSRTNAGWLLGGVDGAAEGSTEKYDLSNDTVDSVARGSLVAVMPKGDGHSGDAGFGRIINRLGNVASQAIDYDNDTVISEARVSMPDADDTDMIDATMTLSNHESLYWGYPSPGWTSDGSSYHGACDLTKVEFDNDTAIHSTIALTSDASGGGTSGIFGHVYDNKDYGWFSQFTGLDSSECADGIDFLRLSKITDSMVFESRIAGMGLGSSCGGTDSTCYRKTSANNANYGYSVRGAGDSSNRLDLNNDTLDYVTRASSPTDKRNACSISDWIVSSFKPATTNTRMGTYAGTVTEQIGLLSLPKAAVGIVGSTVQVLPRKDQNITTPIGWLTLASKLEATTGYDTIGNYTASEHFEGYISDVNVAPRTAMETTLRHLPYSYKLVEIVSFVDEHTSPSTFTFLIEGADELPKHYYFDTGDSNNIVEITEVNKASITAAEVSVFNSELATLQSTFGNRAKIGLVPYSMESTNGAKLSKTYVETKMVINPLHSRIFGMDSSGNYSEALSSTNARLTNRMFVYNGRALIVDKGLNQEYSTITDLVSKERLSDISSSHTYDNIKAMETPAGFILFVTRATASKADRDLIFIGKDDHWHIAPMERDQTASDHSDIGTYDIFDDVWGIQSCLTSPDDAEWNDKSREYLKGTNRVLAVPSRVDVLIGAIDNLVARQCYQMIAVTTTDKWDFSYIFPELNLTKFELTASTSPASWGNLSWTFADGVSSPHFNAGEMFSTVLLGYYGLATDNWQVLSNFNLLLHCNGSMRDSLPADMVVVNGASFLTIHLGSVDIASALITEPADSNKFFLV